MFGWRNKRDVREQAAEYATRRDFQRIFTEEMAGLHLLALLLTADQAKAEQCFVAGLEESVRGNAVFKQWARSWSKRAIIKNAIKAISPASGVSGLGADDCRNGPASASGTLAGNGNAWSTAAESYGAEARALVAAVTSLEPFNRFVLVMAVLEGFSVHECSALLGRSASEVAAAKTQALEQLGSLPARGQADRENVSASWSSFLAPTQVA